MIDKGYLIVEKDFEFFWYSEDLKTTRFLCNTEYKEIINLIDAVLKKLTTNDILIIDCATGECYYKNKKTKKSDKVKDIVFNFFNKGVVDDEV